MNDTTLIISNDDFQKITSLIRSSNNETAVLLEEELGRAAIVADEQLPSDVVAMNSIVKFVDLESKKESTVTLVFPQDANVEEHKVSVLAPIGAALIGLKVGHTISWPLPNGKERQIKVVSVTNEQPKE